MNNRSNSSITVAGQPAVITYVPELNMSVDALLACQVTVILSLTA